MEVSDGVAEHALGGPSSATRDLRESGKHALAAAQSLLEQADVPCTSEVRKGYGPLVIAEYAKTMNCDAIVMSTRGMGSTGEILGSIARQVIGLADIPVTLVK